MPMPPRLVCAFCLASVESSSDDDRYIARFCPSCASPLENSYLGTSHSAETSEVAARGESWRAFDVETPQSDDTFPSGRIGRFTLGKWLGGGGYGDVFQAHDSRLDRVVALKILKPTKLDSKAIERFLREARAAARLEHPFIVGLHDAGRFEGRLWIAYHLVPGLTLSQRRDERTLDLRASVAIVRDLADALDHAHRRGVTHRDLKPANVIVDDDGRPHLTDFGLARRLDLESELTGEGTVLGTPAYMSPEQAAGRAHAADGRSDIYSLGVILYELICGRRPSDVPSHSPSWKVDRDAPPPPGPHTADLKIPQELDRICMKALALNPADRFASARTMCQALDKWLQRVPAVRPKPKRKVALLAMGLVLVLGLGVFQLRRKEHVDDQLTLIRSNPEARTTLDRPSPSEPTPKSRVVAASPSDAKDLSVVANTDSHIVHVKDCPHALRLKEKHRKEYPSLADALAAGQAAVCKWCEKKMPTP